ncbi:hypothetical protein ACFX13_007070 [Malus domestica]
MVISFREEFLEKTTWRQVRVANTHRPGANKDKNRVNSKKKSKDKHNSNMSISRVPKLSSITLLLKKRNANSLITG